MKGKMGGGGQVKDGGGRLCVQTLSWWEEGFFLGTKSGCFGFAAAMELVHQPATYKSRLQSRARVPPPATHTADLDLA